MIKRLKECRIEKQLNQKEVAKKLNITQQTYSDYETGRTNPDIDSLIKIANILGVTADYLLGREDDFGNITIKNSPAEKLSAEDKELLEYFHSLTKSEKLQVTEYTRYLSERGESQKKPVRKNKLA